MRMADKIMEAFSVGLEYVPEKLTAYYDDWAEEGSYDKTLQATAYIGPEWVAAKLSELLSDKDARILDIGCGTGMVGEELFKRGFTNICAVDASERSLNVCRDKGCYKEFVKCLVGPERVSREDKSYDAAISSGTFVPGHCDGTSLQEVIRLLKPGGLAVIATRKSYFVDYREDKFNFMAVTDKLLADKVCSLETEELPDYSRGNLGIISMYTVI